MNELLVVTPNGYKASKLYSVVPTDGSGDLTWVRNTTATRVNSSGLIELISANVPRLDYTGGVTCPCILVEPQRANLVTYSEQFDNAAWVKYGGQVITTNNTTSPDNTLTADKMTSTGGIYNISFTWVADTYYSLSFFVKTDTATFFTVEYTDYFSGVTYDAGRANIQFSNGATSILQQPLNATLTATSEAFVNGWYRFTLKFKTNALKNFTYIQLNATGGTMWIWGAQLEAGTSQTSYIPTVASTVTRNADVGTVTTPVAITSLIETYEDGSTNVVNPIPVTYQMSEGRIAKVVGL